MGGHRGSPRLFAHPTYSRCARISGDPGPVLSLRRCKLQLWPVRSECAGTLCRTPGLPSRLPYPSPLPRVYPMNSRCARNHGGPPRVYKERSGPPTFPRRGNVGVSSAHPPRVGSFLLFYHPSIAVVQPTLYHPSPQEGVPLGGEERARGPRTFPGSLNKWDELRLDGV